jgi:hypothetical protein
MVTVEDDIAVILEGNRKLFLVLRKGNRWRVSNCFEQRRGLEQRTHFREGHLQMTAVAI